LDDYKKLFQERPELLESIEGGKADLSPEFSEDWLALQFTARHSDTMRYVAEWGAWLSWDGSVWKRETTLRAYDLARAICRESSTCCEKESVRSRLAQASTVAAVERMARADRQFAANTEQWNLDTQQLNCPSGTIDLASGKVLAHNPTHFHTKITGASPVRGKNPDLWFSFLDRVTSGDKALQSYLQRVVGYCLTGSTREHAMFFLYGTGSNGKSVFTSTLTGILGDYVRSTPAEVFTETKNEQHPCAVAALQGVRLAITQETERNARWAESRVKQMTGGDKLSARFMHQNFFEFSPQFKIMVCGNHRPRLGSVDEAIRRRLHLIPFLVTIPPDERDPRLPEKLRAEWPAILGWAVEGCIQWQREGLQPPKVVTDATDEYLSNEDKIGLWLESRCILGRAASAGSTAAFNDFKSWCEEMNEQPGSQRTFSQELLSREGITSKKGMHGNSFVGFALKSVVGTE
jgi:putative DNA primase/helicase